MSSGTNPRGIPYAGLAALKLASALVPESLGGQALRREFARKLVGMRGIPMKMSQIISMSREQAVAGLHLEALSQARAAAAPEIILRLQAADPGFMAKVAEFSEKGIAASLGQVHRLVMKDGRACALKIKHAGIGPAMDLDAGLMEFMVSVFGSFRAGFGMDEYKRLLTRELRWELDYPFELERQERAWRHFRNRPGIRIPRPYASESGAEHILMDWEDSRTIEEFARTAAGNDLEEAALRLAEFHLASIFELGMAHADPNPGNFGIRRDASGLYLVVYDFGSLAPLEPRIRDGLGNLLAETASGRDPYPALIGMGFQPEPLSAIRNKLAALCAILLEPFLAGGGFKIGEWNRGPRVKALLGAERWNLMIAAPPELFFLMRAFHGLFHYADRLGTLPDLGKCLPDPWKLSSAKKANEEPGSAGNREVQSGFSPTPNPENGATHLRILVRNRGETKASITMPANAIYRIDDIIDPDLLADLKSRGLDPAAIAQGGTGAFPRSVFEWTDGPKEVKIWLE